MTPLLSRHAECLFWFGRYTERAACLARLLEVHASISQGRTGDAASWAWILTLYDDHEKFKENYDTPSGANVLRFYVSDADNPGSLHSCIQIARENARTLRALISTELWQQVNTFYNRFRALLAADLSEAGVAHTCQLVKKECYAQIGVAEATFYRDTAWSFFRLGLLVERADQMSRLLDVRFAQARSVDGDANVTMGDFGFWALLLRSSAAQQAFLRRARGQREPAMVARFLIFDTGLPRSIAYCVGELEAVLGELRRAFGLRGNSHALEQVDVLREMLMLASEDKRLVQSLHAFNDGIQQELIKLTSELSYAFFGHERPEAAIMAAEDLLGTMAMTQSQAQSETPSQAQSEAAAPDEPAAKSTQTQSQTQSSS